MQYLVTAEEMRRYDNNTIEKIGIPAFTLMERAALKACGNVLNYLKLQGKYSKDTTPMQVGTASLQGDNDCTKCPEGQPSVLIMAGYGNNGGDGLALARLLSECGIEVTLWCVGDEKRASLMWMQQRRILEHYPIRVVGEASGFGQKASEGSRITVLKDSYEVCVDALFGVGLSRRVTGAYAEAINTFNQIAGWRLALDIPSGICADTGNVLGVCVKADETITFGFCKRGLVLYPGAEYAGHVEVADIGITDRSFFGEAPEMFTWTGAAKALLPKRSMDGNKGTFGKVLLVAGSVNMAGAAVLAAKAAYRCGAGMVKVISPGENRVILQETIPEALFGTEENLADSLVWADVIGIGPGLGTDERARALLKAVLKDSDKPLVVDADALNLLAKDRNGDALGLTCGSVTGSDRKGENLADMLAEQGARGRSLILTPHVGELARLVGRSVSDCLSQGAYRIGEIAYETAVSLHGIIVAKSARTFVCGEKSPRYLNRNGNNGMATAGSGDVLTGMLVALLGQGMEPFDAAVTGVYLHGAAGDVAKYAVGAHACMAGDIAEAIPRV